MDEQPNVKVGKQVLGNFHGVAFLRQKKKSHPQLLRSWGPRVPLFFSGCFAVPTEDEFSVSMTTSKDVPIYASVNRRGSFR